MKAEKGDLIRIVNTLPERTTYKNGDIFEVIFIDEDGDANFIDKEGDQAYTTDNEYVIHRKAGEEEPVAKRLCDTCKSKLGEIACSSLMGGTFCSVSCADAFVHFRTPVASQPQKAQDAVNSPNHYTQGRFETIEVIEEITKGYSDGYVAYCVGNALKYLARAPFKHGEPTEDLAKAERYLAFANAYLSQSTE